MRMLGYAPQLYVKWVESLITRALWQHKHLIQRTMALIAKAAQEIEWERGAFMYKVIVARFPYLFGVNKNKQKRANKRKRDKPG